MKAYGGSGFPAPVFPNLGWLTAELSNECPGGFILGEKIISIEWEAGCTLESVWTIFTEEKNYSTEMGTTDISVGSLVTNKLSYLGSLYCNSDENKIFINART